MTSAERFNLLVEAANLTLNDIYASPTERILEIYGELFSKQKLAEIITSDNPNKHLYFGAWDNHLEAEIKNQGLTNEDAKKIISRLVDTYPKNWMLINLIKKSISEGDLDLAESIIPDLPNIDTSTGSYQRSSGKVFAWQQ